jgi:hypothetical protein
MLTTSSPDLSAAILTLSLLSDNEPVTLHFIRQAVMMYDQNSLIKQHIKRQDNICNFIIHMFIQVFMAADRTFPKLKKTFRGFKFLKSIQYSETCNTSQLSVHIYDNVRPGPYMNFFHNALKKFFGFKHLTINFTI